MPHLLKRIEALEEEAAHHTRAIVALQNWRENPAHMEIPMTTAHIDASIEALEKGIRKHERSIEAARKGIERLKREREGQDE